MASLMPSVSWLCSAGKQWHASAAVTDPAVTDITGTNQRKQLRLVFGTKVIPHPDKVNHETLSCSLQAASTSGSWPSALQHGRAALMGRAAHTQLALHCRRPMEERMLSSSAMLAAAQWEWLTGSGAGRRVASILQVRDTVLSFSLRTLPLTMIHLVSTRHLLIRVDMYSVIG